jgi:hypothetical protein
MKKAVLALFCVIIGLATGCESAASHSKALNDEPPVEKFTLGNVQRKVSKGMSQADVASSLGSPNIVTKDSSGKEAWIYDKVAREVSYSHDQGGVWLILGAYSKEAGASRTSQSTLTVVIKFDDQGQVNDVTYHSSQF